LSIPVADADVHNVLVAWTVVGLGSCWILLSLVLGSAVGCSIILFSLCFLFVGCLVWLKIILEVILIVIVICITLFVLFILLSELLGLREDHSAVLASGTGWPISARYWQRTLIG